MRAARPPACSTARSTSPRRSRSAATAPRAGRRACRRPWSRHDLAFGAAAVARRRRSRSAPGSPASAPFSAYPSLACAGRRHARSRWRSAIARVRAGAVRRPPGDRAMSVLELDGVTYTYPGAAAPALDEVSLEIEPGELVVVAGASGSGKSTLLRVGERSRAALPRRHVRRARRSSPGMDTREHGPGELARAVGTLFQDPETQVVMGTVRAELAFALENRGEAPAAVARAVEEVALALGIAHLLDRSTDRAVRRRAAARRARRGARGAAAAGRARRADLAARPGRRRRADRVCCAAATRTSTRRSCSPSIGSSAAWRPPTG